MAIALDATSETWERLREDRRSRKLRSLVVLSALFFLTFTLAALSMMLGSFDLGVIEVLGSLSRTRVDPAIDFIVLELRFPQTHAALTTGMALGIAGTLFQQLLRNPLASPDFVGVSAGASLAAVAGIVIYDFSGAGIPTLALLGSFFSAVLMYLLAWRDGVSGYRFILIGIGVSAFMIGLVGYLLTRANLYDARAAMHWLVGSVGQSGPTEIALLTWGLAFLVPLATILQRALRTLELGDDAARGLGARPELGRFALLAISVILTGLATAVAGPIIFVALVAGPVASRLLGPARGSVLAAAFTGACLLMLADVVALHVLPTELPTGVVTGAVGAPYLLWLLAATNKEGNGS